VSYWLCALGACRGVLPTVLHCRASRRVLHSYKVGNGLCTVCHVASAVMEQVWGAAVSRVDGVAPEESQSNCCLRSQTAMRVWDALLHEGAKVIYRVALALLKIHEAALLKQDNAGFVLREAKLAANATHDREMLMKVWLRHGWFRGPRNGHCRKKPQLPPVVL
jgi:hypothetical protein